MDLLLSVLCVRFPLSIYLLARQSKGPAALGAETWEMAQKGVLRDLRVAGSGDPRPVFSGVWVTNGGLG